MLANLAEALQSAIFIKEAGDDLLDCPIGSLVGQSPNYGRVRSCPAIGEMREMTPHKLWQFAIPDVMLASGYAIDCWQRDIDPPGPIPIVDVQRRVREFLTRAEGWTAVMPPSWAGPLSKSDGEAMQ